MGNKIVELKEQVYEYVHNRGPVLPATVAKEFRSTNLFISALLSELVTQKKVKLTRAKVGGSPLYFCPHQSDRLATLLRKHLTTQQKDSLDSLQEKSVLRDRDCLPFERIALRELQDFAKPVRFVIQDIEEIFWKWHMLPDDEAKDIITSMLEQIYMPSSNKKKTSIFEAKKVKEAIKEAKETLIVEEELIPATFEVVDSGKGQASQMKLVEKEPVKVDSKKKKVAKKKVSKVKTKKPEIELNIDDHFERVVLQYLKKKRIKVLDKTTVKKDREMNYIVTVPSNAGELRYFVKARKKKKLSEGDLLLAFTEGQDKKLSTIVVSNAELSKKCKAFMEKSMPGLRYIRLE